MPKPSLPLLTLVLLAGSACGSDPDGDDTPEDPGPALWGLLQEAGYRATWRRAPGYEARQPAAGPHGRQVEIFVNPTVAAALDAGAPLSAWPVGSIVVKDAYDGDAVVQIPAMRKLSEGWFWGEYSPSGTLEAGGLAARDCVTCHRLGDDHVMSFSLPGS